MKRFLVGMAACLMVLFLANGFAFGFGTNITIFDENGNRDKGSGQGGEDEETEPGMEFRQKWDLEGIFFEENGDLTIIGGYDFINGESGNGNDFDSGDIFIDVDGDAVFGDTDDKDGIETVTDTFGYDYAVVFDRDNENLKNPYIYSLIELNASTETLTTYYKQNGGSNPWRWKSGGVTISSGLSYEYATGVTGTGFTGDSHNALTVDISALFPHMTGDFIVHFTQECGNDNIMGQGTAPVPEPATVLLLGIGLIGTGAILRKKRNM